LELPPAQRAVACRVLNVRRMNEPVDLFGQSEFRAGVPGFWERFLNSESVSELTDLEKLLAGCEIIAALDGTNLFLA
jgi:hypothetical protein